MAKFEIWGRRPAAAKADVSEKLGEVKPADPLTGWAVKTGGGALVARLGTLRVYIDRLGSMTIEGDEDGAELLGAYVRVDAIEALIAKWREAQS